VDTIGLLLRLPAHHETYVYWSMVIVMTRSLARNAAGTSDQLSQMLPGFQAGCNVGLDPIPLTV